MYFKQENVPPLTLLHIELNVYNEKDLGNLSIDSMPKIMSSPTNLSFRSVTYSHARTQSTNEQAEHSTSSGKAHDPGLGNMNETMSSLSLNDVLLENVFKTLQTSFDTKILEFKSGIKEIQNSKFDSLSSKVDKINKEMRKLDETNVNTIDRGQILHKMLKSLKSKYDSQGKIVQNLEAFINSLQTTLSEKISTLEDSVDKLEKRQHTCESETELGQYSENVKELLDRTASAEELDQALSGHVDVQKNGKL